MLNISSAQHYMTFQANSRAWRKDKRSTCNIKQKNYLFLTDIYVNTNLLADTYRFCAFQSVVLSSSSNHDSAQHSIHNRNEYLLGLAALLSISDLKIEFLWTNNLKNSNIYL